MISAGKARDLLRDVQFPGVRSSLCSVAGESVWMLSVLRRSRFHVLHRCQRQTDEKSKRQREGMGVCVMRPLLTQGRNSGGWRRKRKRNSCSCRNTARVERTPHKVSGRGWEDTREGAASSGRNT